MDAIEQQAKKLGAIEKRQYSSYWNAFEFYVLSKKLSNGYYIIFRFIPMLGGSGSWQETLGASDWVEDSKIIEKYSSDQTLNASNE